jgi:large subunit ribosomal protein L18
MNKIEQKNYHRMRRHNRIRSKVSGTAVIPRLAIFRSARFITAQLIDDTKGVTLAAASDMKLKKGSKIERAQSVGSDIAKEAKEKKITKVVFDRGGFLYAGRVKALADAARGAGLIF